MRFGPPEPLPAVLGAVGAAEALRRLTREVSVPVIASGGAGAVEHFGDAFAAGADAALAASVFHFGDIAIPALKEELARAGHAIRL